MGDIRMVWDGVDEFERWLKTSPDKALAAAAKSLFQSGETVMTRSKRVVPVKDGILKASGHVKPPDTSRTRTEVTLGYGGAASAYARYQHERTDLHHPGQGQAKYLEQPFNAATSQIQRKLARDLAKAMR